MFSFKQFTIHQDRSAMKVTTDSCLFGAWAARKIHENFPGPVEILDIGTGTGLLSLMVAQQIMHAKFDAVEIEPNAFLQASENFLASPWNDRLNAENADILRYVFSRKYDIIISNPPFYEKELTSDDPQRRIAHHQGGLRWKDLFSLISRNLNENGSFYLLLPYKRAKEARELMDSSGLSIRSLVLIKQTPDHDYFRIMIEGERGSQNKEVGFEEIIIKEENEVYSDKFTALLKDYYLYL